MLRGQVVGAGTFAGRAIEETPPAAFVAEMRRWGVRHLFVWTDASRDTSLAAGSSPSDGAAGYGRISS